MNFEFWPNKKGWISNFYPTKRGILNFDPFTSLEILTSPFLLGLFENVARFARKLFWAFIWTLYLAYPKLVGTPCRGILASAVLGECDGVEKRQQQGIWDSREERRQKGRRGHNTPLTQLHSFFFSAAFSSLNCIVVRAWPEFSSDVDNFNYLLGTRIKQ